MGNSLVIRADANAHMGTGHLMRCLALAQGWKARGGQATFVTTCESDMLCGRLSDEGFQVGKIERPYPDPGDSAITLQALVAHSDAWLVLDGYHFASDYQRQIKEAGRLLLVIDDTAHLAHYWADVVLNQNINAQGLHYACEPYTRLLLGTRYVLLRSEFLAWRGWRREIPEVARKVLVTLGGSDPDNQTLKVIRALQQMDVDGLEAVIVVGASNPHSRELRSAVRGSRRAIRLVHNAENMPELMAWADVAVSAGGSTCWEMAFMGLPAVILVLAENQRGIATGLDEAGVVASVGWHAGVSSSQVASTLRRLCKDQGLRRQMSRQGRQVVDGLGVERVINFLSV
jgi:UDP-2,4-diacetamido-2,4,6-trideoxy-beta-L-altropyranose hydrolase